MMPADKLSDNDLTRLVTHVTSTMLGMSFSPTAGRPPTPDALFRIAMLPIPGVPGILVALSSDKGTCCTMAAKMFMTDEGSVDQQMMNDTLTELVNMTAGQIKNALGLDRALGLPKVLDKQGNVAIDPNRWRGVRMMSGAHEVALWLAVADAVAQAA
jgi:hypothetical protein